LLFAFREVIKDFIASGNKAISIELDQTIKAMIDYTTKCRPLSMSNVIKFLKSEMQQMDSNLNSEEFKIN
jgi:translation initiation factor 2B subunit (eIF-2B alpha/beta/delta family)